MVKVLFVICGFSGNGAQAIRFKNIVPRLGPEFDVEVIELTHSYRPEVVRDGGVTIHSVPFSKVGRLLNPRAKRQEQSSDVQRVGRQKPGARSTLLGVLKRNVRKLIFPDTYPFEVGNISRKIDELMRNDPERSLVISAFPFSMLMLAKRVKHAYPGVVVHYDIGDPFSHSSVNGRIRNWLARKYEERYIGSIDTLVVTNNATKDYYRNAFRKAMKDVDTHVICMGVSESYLGAIPIADTRQDRVAVSLVYAGRLYSRLREAFALYQAMEKVNAHGTRRYHLHMYGVYNDALYPEHYDESHITFHGNVSNEQVFSAYGASDIIVFIDNAFGIQTPGKVFEVAAIGKPILFISDNRESMSVDIVKSLDHVAKCANEPQAIEDAILALEAYGSVNKEKIQHVRRMFSWENRAREFRQVLMAKTNDRYEA